MKLQSRSEYYKNRTKMDHTVCVLCHGEQVVLHEANHWAWIAALAPYWKYHTMLVPKRHVAEIKDLTLDEWQEFLLLQEKVIQLYRDSHITFNDGTHLKNVLIFWRHRFELFNSVLKADNIEHLHIHFTSDREHFLDPISDEDASTWDVRAFAGKLEI